MSSPNHPIDTVLQSLKTAIRALESAEGNWPSALEASPQAPELSWLEELLHCATHETSNTLAFLVQDIETLLARIRVRQQFTIFSTDQFDRIITQGWSTGLVHELHREIPALSLLELSAQTKRLCSAWSVLPKVKFSNASDNDSGLQ